MPYPRDEFPAELREYKCDGSHGLTYSRALHDSEHDGSVIELTVEWCADPTCAEFVRTTCHHAHNSWQYTSDHKASDDELDEKGTSALQCDFCGKDGT